MPAPMPALAPVDRSEASVGAAGEMLTVWVGV